MLGSMPEPGAGRSAPAAGGHAETGVGGVSCAGGGEHRGTCSPAGARPGMGSRRWDPGGRACLPAESLSYAAMAKLLRRDALGLAGGFNEEPFTDDLTSVPPAAGWDQVECCGIRQ